VSIYTAIDEGEPAFLCSNSGWRDFRAWAAGGGVDLRHLCDHGWHDQPGTVAAQLRALRQERPPPPDVAPVADSLLGVLADASEDAVLVITDGLGPAGTDTPPPAG
jgi:hypothetical protein